MKPSIAREVRTRSSSGYVALWIKFEDVDCKLHQLASKLQLGQGAPSFFGT
ncbi:unnamed protein product [Prunus armeniaca]|uniref:Uncharacterized protein n=1 Tax=Prunus armeniaca TaxID=36596 RepID=A0A6J5U1E6_PRUAR|nr:unnamed protein product [Prunus armeniaca]CAB4300615.1 unnamed protein product [Prunus armeniaca]